MVKNLLGIQILNSNFKFIASSLLFVFLIGINNFLFSQTTYTWTSTSSWTCPIGVTSIQVQAWGAGGGGGYGGGTNKFGGGGGGGGAYTINTSLSVTAGTTYTITINSIGLGGTIGTPNGGTGGSSIFGTSAVVANGGVGGLSYTNGGIGGAGGTGTYNGGSGGTGISTGSGGGGEGAGTTANGGNGSMPNGGTGTDGGDGGAGNIANTVVGLPGANYGGGGGGGTKAVNGGDGASGRVIISYNCPTTTTAAAGADQSLAINLTTTTLAGNTPSIGTGTWTVISGTATITTPSSAASGVTGLVLGNSATLRWTITNNDGCSSNYDDVIITANVDPTCLVYFYNKAAGIAALQTLSNWGLNADGTGTAPANFTANCQIFTIKNGTSAGITAPWTVSGTGSKVVIGDPGVAAVTFQVTATNAFTGKVDIPAASSGSNTLWLLNAAVPTFGTLNAASTVDYGYAGTQTITATTYGNLSVTGASTKTFGGTSTTVAGNYTQSATTVNLNDGSSTSNALTVNGNFNISAGFFNLQNASTGADATAMVTVGGATTVSGTGGIQLANGGSLTLATASIFQTVNFTSTSTSTSVIDFGTYTGGKDNQFRISGNFTKSGTGTFKTSGTGPNGGIYFNGGGSAQTFSYAGTNSDYTSITVNSGALLQMSTAFTVSALTGPPSTFSVYGTLDCGTLAPCILGGATNGTFLLNSGSTIKSANINGISSTTIGSISTSVANKTYADGANYIFYGTANQNTAFFNSTVNNLTINNTGTSGSNTVTNNVANVITNGVFTLTSGILATSGTNSLTIANTATSSLVGGSTTSFVRGPLIRKIPASLTASSSVYNFPVGKTNTYLPFSITTLTTGTTIPTITVEAFDANCAGTGSASVTSLSTTEYWSASFTGDYVDGSVSLRRQSALGSLNAIGKCATINGSYVSYGGTISGTSINNCYSTSNSLGFFAMALKVACSTPSPGTYTIGPSGDNYTSIAAAINAISCEPLTGAYIFELQADYVSSVETFPLALGNILGASSSNTVTIRPATGANALSITSSNATATLNLNGCNYFIIDGRPGGAGGLDANCLSIANTVTTGIAIQLINDATYNIIKYCDIKGVNTSASEGVVFFSTAAGGSGNDYNLIDYCNIHDGASTPAICIASLGTDTKENSGNAISNCNIYNFHSTTTTMAGIYAGIYSTQFTITGNSFYQTVDRAGTAALASYGIDIVNTASYGHSITGNFIGGKGPNCGGAAWTITNSVNYVFRGIYLSVGSAQSSTITNNTIKNLSWSATPSTSLHFQGISFNDGIGLINSNTIGDNTAANTIVSNTGYNGALSVGIYTNSLNPVTIQSNTIGGIRTISTGVTISHSFYAIYTTGSSGSVSIIDNRIGSTSTANSIITSQASTEATSGQYNVGIRNFHNGTVSITDNIISNLSNSYAGTVSDNCLGGIVSSAGTNTISTNSIYSLSSSHPATSTELLASVIGILQYSSVAAIQTITANTIYGLSNTAGAAAITVSGIYNQGSASATHVITKNVIHSLTATSTAATVIGINVNDGKHDIVNNMIRLGLSTAGASITTQIKFQGIRIGALATNTNNVYYNSVYIGGTGVTNSANNTACIFRNEPTSTTSLKNNIFYNARSNTSTTTGFHCAIQTIAAGTNGLTSQYNDLFVNGTDGVIGRINTTNSVTLANWQAASGTPDVTGSISTDPGFTSPTSATPDLHILSTNCGVANKGIAISGHTTDYDIETRALGGADIGADEFGGNISSSSTVSMGCSSSPTNLTIAGYGGATIQWQVNTSPPPTYSFVNVSDGVNPTSATYTTGSATSTKYYRATMTNGCTSYSDIITVSRTTPAGTYSIGPSSDDFTSIGSALTSVCSPITGAYIFELQSDYVSSVETFPLTIGYIAGTSSSNTITIRPAIGANSLSIASTNVTATLSLDAANYIIFDGRPGGTGVVDANTMIISNDQTTGITVQFLNDASYNTLQYCDIKGENTSLTEGVILFGTAATGTTGNDNNLLNYCWIHELVTNPAICIQSIGTVAKENDNNTISNNNIYNFDGAASSDAVGVAIEQNSSEFIITNNSFYQTVDRTGSSAATIYVIFVNNTSACTITGNFIGGKSALCGGAPWTISTGSAADYQFNGIYANVGTSTPSTISNNTIKNISWNAAPITSSHFVAIVLGDGKIECANNIIGEATGTSSIVSRTTVSGAATIGILNASTSTVNITGNAIGSVTASSSSNTLNHHFRAIYNQATSGTITISGNLIGSASTSNSINASSASTSTTAQEVIGIKSTQAAGTVSITDNFIYNLNNASVTDPTTDVTMVAGIKTTAGINTLTGNTIRNLYCSAPHGGSDGSAAVVGIAQMSTASGVQTISGNTIYALSNTAASTSNFVVGIHNEGNGTASVISKNLIHSLKAISTTAACVGISVGVVASKHDIINNMIRLGTDEAGADIITQTIFQGIRISATGTHNVFYNSVYLRGRNVTNSSNHTTCFFRNEASSTLEVKNNIFYNARSNTSSTTGFHCAFQVIASGTVGLTSSHNNLFVSGVNGVIGRRDVTNYTRATWPTNTNLPDSTGSIFVNPNFIDTTSIFPNLHITASNCGVADQGIVVSGYTTDFDGDNRATGLVADQTAPDIGADEYSGNISTPSIVAGCSGASTNITVSGYGAGTLQWQESNDNGASDDWVNAIGGSGATSSTYTTDALTSNKYFRVAVTNGCTAYTNSTLVSLTPGPSISVQPSNTSSCDGGSANFSITASGTTITYQWQESPAGCGSYTNLSNTSVYSGTTTSTLNISNCVGLNGKCYRCVVGGCGTINSNNATLTVGLTTLTWVGAGAGGGGTDFNTAANWSPAVTPSVCHACVFTTTSAATVTLSSSVDIGSLTMSHSGATLNFTLKANTYTLGILGTTNANITSGDGTTYIMFDVAGGAFNFNGNATFAAATGNTWVIYSSVNNTGSVTFSGDLILNPGMTSGSTRPATVTFDATVSQTIYNNQSASFCGLGNITTNIGSVNNPIVTLAGSGSATVGPRVMGDLNINGTSVLDLGTKTLNRSAAGGTFTMAAGSTLKLGSNTSGQTGSNFPLNFTTLSISPTSTVEYNSLNAVNQTIYDVASLGYGHLTLTNGTGSGASTKTAGGALDVRGNLTISDAFTTFHAGTILIHNIAGNWINNGTSSNLTFGTASSIVCNGSTEQTIGGSSSTTFNHLTINNTTANGGVTINSSPTLTGTLTLTDGVFTTGANRITITNTSAASVIHSTGSASFINGNLRRYIASNSSTYEFPVGDGATSTSYKRLDFLNNNLVTTTYIDASVASTTQSGNNVDANLSSTQNGVPIVNLLNSAIWTLTPDIQPTEGTYGVNLYVANVTTLSSADDNNFCPVKRADASIDYADWSTNSGNAIPCENLAGRIYDSGNGYAQRLGYNSFSKHAIAKAASILDCTVNLYWIGNVGNWNDNGHWSYSSNGSSAGISCGGTIVNFDSNSFSGAPQNITLLPGTWNIKGINFLDVNKTPILIGEGVLIIGP